MRDDISSIVLIDDSKDLLDELATALAGVVGNGQVDIRAWHPEAGQDIDAEFERRVDGTTTLVVTDYDLTRGIGGLFGDAIVSWCQQRAIPVGDFSRGNNHRLPDEPNLFELRVPTDTDGAAVYVASVFQGFHDLSCLMEQALEEGRDFRSPAEALAFAVDDPTLEVQFSLYTSRVVASNSGLFDRLRGAPDKDVEGSKGRLLSYIVGHVLLNAVMKYPGPLLSSEALSAYLSTSCNQIEASQELFATALYTGPFGGTGSFFRRSEVDLILSASDDAVGEVAVTTKAAYDRELFSAVIAGVPEAHGCERCGGTSGGYLCPFMHRPVCERVDCSVSANSWIPPGADLCRIERDFYDEWAPVLGL